MARVNKIKKYQSFILEILTEYAKVRYINIKGGNHLVADKENHRYQVVTMGFDNNLYVHDTPMHMDIIDGKIWIQRNMTEIDLGEELVKRGVPKSDIVLGFFSPVMREYTEYAVA